MAATDPGPEGAGEEQEARIASWRGYLRRRQALHATDADELEDHLRGQIRALSEAGLSDDEAFLVGVRRVGALDALTREFAREHSERLWKQLVGTGKTGPPGRAARLEAVVVLGLAALAAAAVKLPELFGLQLGDNGSDHFYARNISLFVLPCLAGYFAWKRGLARGGWLRLGLAFALAAAWINAAPFVAGGDSAVLSVIHLPMALWLAVGVAYTGGRWESSRDRMNFVRFSGELLIYWLLIALGGVPLNLLTIAVFGAIGIDAEWFVTQWLLPCGALGAVVVAAWLVEAKQSVIENMAPVLTRVFTPLFTAVLLTFLATMAWTGAGMTADRDVLIGFDVLLAVVLALLLYAISARDPAAPPDWFDTLLLVLVVSALLVDAIALGAIATRISEFGFSANKTAALGENLILLANLSWSAWLYLRFFRGRGSFTALERWQTGFLPVYAGWAALVVVAFPPLFGYA